MTITARTMTATLPSPYAGVRLPVILAHELFHVLRRADVNILDVGRRVHNVFGKALVLSLSDIPNAPLN